MSSGFCSTTSYSQPLQCAESVRPVMMESHDAWLHTTSPLRSRAPVARSQTSCVVGRTAPVASVVQHQLRYRLFSMSSAAAAGPTTATPPANTARGATADLADVFIPEPVDEVAQRKVNIMEPIFQDLGGNMRFSGRVSTVKCFENNPLVRKAFEQPGNGRVLVVDGGGSKRCALLGDNIAEMAYKNGWSGVIINGCIRDSEDIAKMPLGVKALGTYPLKSSKRDPGLSDVPVTIAGVTVHPGDWVYADKDGVLVAKVELKL